MMEINRNIMITAALEFATSLESMAKDCSDKITKRLIKREAFRVFDELSRMDDDPNYAPDINWERVYQHSPTLREFIAANKEVGATKED
jgi:hypothetical protein